MTDEERDALLLKINEVIDLLGTFTVDYERDVAIAHCLSAVSYAIGSGREKELVEAAFALFPQLKEWMEATQQ